jgi:chemotaxis signal transduction protein
LVNIAPDVVHHAPRREDVKRFTVSLEDHTYDRIKAAAEDRNPPATLQQMVRYAVEQIVGTEDTEEASPDLALFEEAVSEADQLPAAGNEPEPTDLSTFRIGGVWFGLPVSKVEGIAARSEVIHLPTMRHDISGTIRFRDTLLAVIDGSSRLGTTAADLEQGQHLVVRRPDGLIALTVDEVGALVPIDTGTWHAPPAGVSDDLAMMGVTAIVDCGDRLVNVLSDLDA